MTGQEMGADFIVEPLCFIESEVVSCYGHLFGFTLGVTEVRVIIVGLSVSISQHRLVIFEG
jgi:hypothetical protein